LRQSWSRHNSPPAVGKTRSSAPDRSLTSRRDEAPPAACRDPLALGEIPAGWPTAGRIEFIRFIRSDRKLRLLGRAITVPNSSAYQYMTATIDLSIAAGRDNLLICDDTGELVSSARIATPRAWSTDQASPGPGPGPVRAPAKSKKSCA